MKMVDEIKSKDIDELAKWLNDNWDDYSPWIIWFEKNYCKECDYVLVDGQPHAWCEVHNKCRFFPEMDEVPDCLQTAKMWLNSEI